MSSHRVDRLAKASIGSRVVLGGLLALAVVVLVNWLAGRPGMRLRVDLTSAGSSSLDPATDRVLKALPGPVTVDVFFRPEAAPLDQVAAAVHFEPGVADGQRRPAKWRGTIRRVNPPSSAAIAAARYRRWRWPSRTICGRAATSAG